MDSLADSKRDRRSRDVTKGVSHDYSGIISTSMRRGGALEASRKRCNLGMPKYSLLY
jgi:hypothetical protein